MSSSDHSLYANPGTRLLLNLQNQSSISISGTESIQMDVTQSSNFDQHEYFLREAKRPKLDSPMDMNQKNDGERNTPYNIDLLNQKPHEAQKNEVSIPSSLQVSQQQGLSQPLNAENLLAFQHWQRMQNIQSLLAANESLQRIHTAASHTNGGMGSQPSNCGNNNGSLQIINYSSDFLSHNHERSQKQGDTSLNTQTQMKISPFHSLQLPPIACSTSLHSSAAMGGMNEDSRSNAVSQPSLNSEMIALAKLSALNDAGQGLGSSAVDSGLAASFLPPSNAAALAMCGGSFSRSASSTGIASIPTTYLSSPMSTVDLLAAGFSRASSCCGAGQGGFARGGSPPRSFSRAGSSSGPLAAGLSRAPSACGPPLSFSRAASACGPPLAPGFGSPGMTAELLTAAGAFSRAGSAPGMPAGAAAGGFSRAGSSSAMTMGLGPLGACLLGPATGFSRAASAPGILALPSGMAQALAHVGLGPVASSPFHRAASATSVVAGMGSAMEAFSRASSAAGLGPDARLLAELAQQSRMAAAADLAWAHRLDPGSGLLRPLMATPGGPGFTSPGLAGGCTTGGGDSGGQNGDGGGGAGTASSGEGRGRGARKCVRIDDPKQLAADFATAVTVASTRGGDWVARNGDESLFSTLRRILPQVCQPGNGRHRLKGKIAGPEFNKLLQAHCGFVCARTRKKSLALTAGNWLFCNRRWLNPADPEDKRSLEQSYEALCAKHPALAHCSRADFLQCLSDVARSWNERI